MTAAEKREAIRNIIIFAVLINGPAWLGPVRRQTNHGE